MIDKWTLMTDELPKVNNNFYLFRDNKNRRFVGKFRVNCADYRYWAVFDLQTKKMLHVSVVSWQEIDDRDFDEFDEDAAEMRLMDFGDK